MSSLPNTTSPSKSASLPVIPKKKRSFWVRVFMPWKGKKRQTVPLASTQAVMPLPEDTQVPEPLSGGGSRAVKPIPDDMLVKELLPGGGSQVISTVHTQAGQWGRTTDSPCTSPTIPGASARYLTVPPRPYTRSHHGSDTSAENDNRSWYSSEFDSEMGTTTSGHPSPTQPEFYPPHGHYQGGIAPPAFQPHTSGAFHAPNALSPVLQTTYVHNNTAYNYTYHAQSQVQTYINNSVHIEGTNMININTRWR